MMMETILVRRNRTCSDRQLQLTNAFGAVKQHGLATVGIPDRDRQPGAVRARE